MEVTDSELMQCLAGGDDLALNALMQRWRERLASFLYKMTGNVESAADLTQETFVKLYQVRNRYRPDGKFSSFLFAIGVNLARNHARWKSRHPTISLDEARDDCLLYTSTTVFSVSNDTSNGCLFCVKQHCPCFRDLSRPVFCVECG